VLLSPGEVHDGGMSDDEQNGELIDDVSQPVHRCIQCQRLLSFSGQPGEATCEACGVRQYLTAPSALYPYGGIGRYA
jgi:hypothetical protein